MKPGLKGLEKDLPNKVSGTKANALLCPHCCVEYDNVEIDLEFEGLIFHNVKALRCPVCMEELLTPEQYATIAVKASDSAKP